MQKFTLVFVDPVALALHQGVDCLAPVRGALVPVDHVVAQSVAQQTQDLAMQTANISINETKRGASTHKLVCRHTVSTHQLRCVGTPNVYFSVFLRIFDEFPTIVGGFHLFLPIFGIFIDFSSIIGRFYPKYIYY